MATGNTNDRKREETARPNAGGDTSRHAGKGDISQPSAGITLHEDKAAYDQKCGKSGLSQPNAGPHDRGKDPKNAAKPDGGDADVPKDRQHLSKVKAHAAGTHEPKGAKGAKYPDGSTTTK